MGLVPMEFRLSCRSAPCADSGEPFHFPPIFSAIPFHQSLSRRMLFPRAMTSTSVTSPMMVKSDFQATPRRIGPRFRVTHCVLRREQGPRCSPSLRSGQILLDDSDQFVTVELRSTVQAEARTYMVGGLRKGARSRVSRCCQLLGTQTLEPSISRNRLLVEVKRYRSSTSHARHCRYTACGRTDKNPT